MNIQRNNSDVVAHYRVLMSHPPRHIHTHNKSEFHSGCGFYVKIPFATLFNTMHI